MRATVAIRRVLQVHTRYRQAGGEDQVVEAERRLLEASGVSVRQVVFDNADLRVGKTLAGDLRLAAEAIWSRRAQSLVRQAVAAHRPDVVHVHNTFAAASPSVFRATGEIPVVQTLHNYRMVCPVATAFRDGAACTDCVGRLVPWPGVVHACVQHSRAQSAVAAATTVVHRALGTFGRVALYLALSEFQRGVLIAGGLPADRIRVVPNFVEPDPGTYERPRVGILFAGRLADEKGIETLLRAAAMNPRVVRVAGSGPRLSQVERAAAAAEVEYIGELRPLAVRDELRGSIALVLPSLWFEGFPLSILEAFATGTPVICSRIGSLAEIVDDGVTGLLADPHDADGLAERLHWAVAHPQEMREMGCNARREYEAKFRGPAHLAALMDAYAAAQAGPKSSAAAAAT